ncbi:MAG: hypothetical protein KGL31_07300 [candidate division NC10 bacterium]|nr:hypothetical protein [candidate division NC10 bacterium]MDE2321708.1 hypothetical protein [candidate division NC10 bacterium]
MVRERRKVSCRWVISVVIVEDKVITYSVVVAIFDHVERRLAAEELFEVKL